MGATRRGGGGVVSSKSPTKNKLLDWEWEKDERDRYGVLAGEDGAHVDILTAYFANLLSDSRSDLRCSKTSSFVHQHLAPSVGNDTKSYVANVKKGPWSPEEEATLKAYIKKHGTGGNWITLPQKIGLRSLYMSIGSRWSIIAAQLLGRTDNDIKNYWNTRLKKKLLGKQHKQQEAQQSRRATIFKKETRKTFTDLLYTALNNAGYLTFRDDDELKRGEDIKLGLQKIIAVLDCKSFSYMFDMELVEKKNVLVGDFMPSVKFTDDLRTCAYLSTTDPNSKRFFFNNELHYVDPDPGHFFQAIREQIFGLQEPC
ncbi:hypothetical protein ACFX13_018722 [Malus domestica]